MTGRHSRFLLLVAAAIQIVVLVSCDLSDREYDYSDYFDGVVGRARKQIDSGNVQQAFALLDSAYAAHPDASRLDHYKQFGLRSYHYINARDLPNAVRYSDSMLSVLKDHLDLPKYKGEYPYVLSVKGSALFDLGKFNEAFHCFYMAKQFVEQYLDKCSYTRLNVNLANVLFKQQRYQAAIPYYKKAYEEHGTCGTFNTWQTEFDERQRSLNNIGLCYERLSRFDSATMYYSKALDLIAKNEPKYPDQQRYIQLARGVVYGNLGNVYMKEGKLSEAEPLLTEGYRINSQKGYDNYDAQFTGVKLANLYIKSGRMKDAYAMMMQVRHTLDTMPHEQAEMRWRRLAWKYYDTLGDVDKAYSYYRHYIVSKDSFEAKRRELPGADYERTFQSFSQQYQIDLLKRDSKLKGAYLILTCAISIMAAVIIYLIWRNYRQSKNNVLELTMLNRQISGQNVSMQKTLDALEQSQEENTRMLKTVAHDLRNPIAAMVSLADLLMDEAPYSAQHMAMLEMIKTSGTNALQIASEILSSNVKPHEMHTDRVALDELLMYSAGLMQIRANEKNQFVHVNVEPVQVMANGEKILRVINNLIVNAIKFSPENKSIDVSLRSNSHCALISIRDEGVGIPVEIKDMIFDAFTLAKRAGTSGEQPFGLGLSISRQIVEAHGGRIWFTSEMGQGTTFFVELPLAAKDDVTMAADTPYAS